MMIAQKTGSLLGREIDPYSQPLQHIRAARLRSNRSIAVLGHGNASGGCDQSDGRGNVKSVEAVAASAADGEDLASACWGVKRQRDTVFAQLASERCYFLRGFAFACKGNQKLSFRRDG